MAPSPISPPPPACFPESPRPEPDTSLFTHSQDRMEKTGSDFSQRRNRVLCMQRLDQNRPSISRNVSWISPSRQADGPSMCIKDSALYTIPACAARQTGGCSFLASTRRYKVSLNSSLYPTGPRWLLPNMAIWALYS